MGSMAAALSPLVPSSRSTPSLKTTNPNVRHVVLGDLLFRTWYPSFYPEELVGRDIDRLYICQWCFKYCQDVVPFLAHRKLCPAQHEPPPGQLIYSKGNHSIYELDGEEDQLFSQNLSLFAKFFLDNKSVFFDVASFNYYLLAANTLHGLQCDHRTQIIGFFSKEKMSWDNNNLACILVFPPWQRSGLGKILMGLSYELSRLENRVGGPEKPLSALGRLGYLKFWQARLANSLLEAKNKSTMSVEEIAKDCWMLEEDVIFTLQEMDVLRNKRAKDGSIMISKSKMREWVCQHRVDLRAPVDEDGFTEDYLVEEDG